MKAIAFLLPILLFTLSANAVIFGADNRHQVTPISSPLVQQLAGATAISVLSSNREIDPKTGAVTIDTSAVDGICSDEPFARDPSLDYACTGFLVAPNLLVTAGHCVYAVNTSHEERINESGPGCSTFDWLFDYESSAGGVTQTKNIPASHLYHCSKIIYATQNQKAPFLDYALIQLDRPVFGRKPFAVNAAPVSLREAVAMIGYPHGTPVKYTDSAVVTMSNSARDSFLTNLDAFEGNSGSPVFNSNQEIVGILVGGTPTNEWVKDPNMNCNRASHCNESGTQCQAPDFGAFIAEIEGYQGVGSEVQRIAPIAEMLKRLAAGQPAH